MCCMHNGASSLSVGQQQRESTGQRHDSGSWCAGWQHGLVGWAQGCRCIVLAVTVCYSSDCRHSLFMPEGMYMRAAHTHTVH